MASIRVGDTVNVPNGMFGIVKFIGSVDGKNGKFAGVELADEFSGRGKNSGDVEGKQYFYTTKPGTGIFLPVDRAEKRMSGSSTSSSTRHTSRTASARGSPSAPSVRQTPRPSMIKPSFSQSVGPVPSLQRVTSPTVLKPPIKRESMGRPTSPVRQRPASPLRKTTTAQPVQTPAAGRLQTPKTRPSIGLARSTIGAGPPSAARSGLRAPSYANGSTKFSQSLRQSTSQTPSRLRGPPSSTQSNTPLGPDDRFDEDDTILEVNEPETTPTPATRQTDRNASDSSAREVEMLQNQLSERDQQLQEQANSIAEMERSLTELTSMMPERMNQPDEADLPRDVQGLRSQLRDRNERIKAMSDEFDGNRADFRSTIDALEMASNETERVYEQRVEELLMQVQQLQERNEDVDSVAQQFKQLEELVQELEEGLEESRRAEAEARSEVEFLRGEVERSKSELRRERERAAAQAALEGGSGGINVEEFEELQAAVSQKDNEIRGLKTIIQSLQGTSVSNIISNGSPATPRANGVKQHSRQQSTVLSPESQASSNALQQQISDLESLLHQKSSRETELQQEVRELRKSVNLGKLVTRGHQKSDSQLEKHNSGGSQRTIVGKNLESAVNHKRKDSTVPELAEANEFFDGRGSPLKEEYVDANDLEEEEERKRRSNEAYKTPPAALSVSETSTGQWCEICEESGHDILNCANMIGTSTHRQPSPEPVTRSSHNTVEDFRHNGGPDRPLNIRKSGTHDPVSAPPDAPLPPPPRTKSFIGSNSGGSNRSSNTPANSAQTASSNTATPTKVIVLEGTGDQAGMIGGKTSGVINPDMWCALCEKDGHESVDCPVEDSF